MYKIKKILLVNINLPYYIICHITTFLTKYDIIYNNIFYNYYEFNIKQRYKNKIEHKII